VVVDLIAELRAGFFLHAPQVPPPAQYLQAEQFEHAAQGSLPVHFAAADLQQVLSPLVNDKNENDANRSRSISRCINQGLINTINAREIDFAFE
jgi:amino acid permease